MKIYVWLSFYDVINDGQVHIWSSGWRRSRHPLRYKYGPAHHWSPSRTTTKRKFSSFIIFHMHRMIGLIKFQHLIWKKIMIFKCLQNKEAWDISPIILNKLAHKSCFSSYSAPLLSRACMHRANHIRVTCAVGARCESCNRARYHATAVIDGLINVGLNFTGSNEMPPFWSFTY